MDYRSLTVWQRSFAFTIRAYEVAKAFPRDERFGLTSQLQRAAVSVPSNIAEGCARGSAADLARFLRIALGSLHAAVCQLMLARELGYLQPVYADSVIAEADEIGRMINAWLRTTKRTIRPTAQLPRADS